jgi:hypothetical protein
MSPLSAWALRGISNYNILSIPDIEGLLTISPKAPREPLLFGEITVAVRGFVGVIGSG